MYGYGYVWLLVFFIGASAPSPPGTPHVVYFIVTSCGVATFFVMNNHLANVSNVPGGLASSATRCESTGL